MPAATIAIVKEQDQTGEVGQEMPDRRERVFTDVRFVVPIVLNFVMVAIAVATMLLSSGRWAARVDASNENLKSALNNAIQRFDGQIGMLVQATNVNTNDVTAMKTENAALRREIEQLKQNFGVVTLQIGTLEKVQARLEGRMSR